MTDGHIQPVADANDERSKENSEQIYLHALEIRNQQLVNELEFLKQSRSYRFIEAIKKTPFAHVLVKLGKLFIRDRTPAERPDLDVAPSSGQGLPQELQNETAQRRATPKSRIPSFQQASDMEWVERQLQKPRPVSINHPDWRGILASSNELFRNVYLIPDDLTVESAKYYARLLREAAPPSITIQGFPITYFHLVKAIREIAPSIPLYNIWHGNLLYTKEDYDWKAFSLMKSLFEEGDFCKVGFVKAGLAEVMTKTGMNAHFIMNLIRHVPENPSTPLAPGTHIGIWAEPDWGWKKLPYAMLASLKLIPDSVGHVHNVSPRTQEFGESMHIEAEYQVNPISRGEVLAKIAQMHVNLYVSLTECAPMLPLESLSVGSPCLMGPTSHYFRDQDFLFKHLIVQFPDNPESIARYAIAAIEARSEIIAAYRQYAPEYNLRALNTLASFLECPLADLA